MICNFLKSISLSGPSTQKALSSPHTKQCLIKRRICIKIKRLNKYRYGDSWRCVSRPDDGSDKMTAPISCDRSEVVKVGDMSKSIKQCKLHACIANSIRKYQIRILDISYTNPYFRTNIIDVKVCLSFTRKNH